MGVEGFPNIQARRVPRRDRRVGARLTAFGDSVPIRAVKFLVPLLALAAFFVAGCATDANRRTLYSPKKADGYWTRKLEDGTYRNRQLVDARLPGVQPTPEYPPNFRHFRED